MNVDTGRVLGVGDRWMAYVPSPDGGPSRGRNHPESNQRVNCWDRDPGQASWDGEGGEEERGGTPSPGWDGTRGQGLSGTILKEQESVRWQRGSSSKSWGQKPSTGKQP